jgi:hypothetical protein
MGICCTWLAVGFLSEMMTIGEVKGKVEEKCNENTQESGGRMDI